MNMTENIEYWAFRLDHKKALYDEMKAGRLRMGWGWLASQNLRKYGKDGEGFEDHGAGKNLPMYWKVKKGHIILATIPSPQAWNKIAIVRATQDWDTGYQFEMLDGEDDYRHVFPVEYITEFHRHNSHIHGDIRSTFRCNRRFWGLSKYSEHIVGLVNKSSEEMGEPSEGENKLRNAINREFHKSFNDELLDKMLKGIQGDYKSAEWESAIKIGIEKITESNSNFRIETTPNIREKEHGSDLLIFFSNPIDITMEYVIAVQVKDYYGKVSDGVGEGAIQQINMSDEYFNDMISQKADEGEAPEKDVQLIQKMLVLTNVPEDINKELLNDAKEQNVKVVFKKQFEDLLLRMASSYVDISRQED